MTEEVSAADARRLVLAAQGFIGAPPAGVGQMLRRLGGVQLDTISTLARSHELVAYARLGPLNRASVEAAYWNHPARTFEYWAHAACILPIEAWPWFAAERRRRRDHPLSRRLASEPAVREVWARLQDGGPQTVAQLGGGRLAAGWWNWSPVKIAVEELYNLGEVVCVSRRGWRRVYDLAERAIPAELLVQDPTDEECHAWTVATTIRGLGVALERRRPHPGWDATGWSSNDLSPPARAR